LKYFVSFLKAYQGAIGNQIPNVHFSVGSVRKMGFFFFFLRMLQRFHKNIRISESKVVIDLKKQPLS